MALHNTPSKKPHRSDGMSRKEALATLHQLYDAYVKIAIDLEVAVRPNTFNTEEQDAFRSRVRHSFDVLTKVVHGPAPLNSLGLLCDLCYLGYATRIAWYHEEQPYRTLKTKCCCPSCYHRLQQAHHLLTDEEIEEALRA